MVLSATFCPQVAPTFTRLSKVAEARLRQTDLVCFPWLDLCGYSFKHLRLSKRVSCRFFFLCFFGKELQIRWLVMHFIPSFHNYLLRIYMGQVCTRQEIHRGTMQLSLVFRKFVVQRGIQRKQHTQLQYSLLKSECRRPENI